MNSKLDIDAVQATQWADVCRCTAKAAFSLGDSTAFSSCACATQTCFQATQWVELVIMHCKSASKEGCTLLGNNSASASCACATQRPDCLQMRDIEDYANRHRRHTLIALATNVQKQAAAKLVRQTARRSQSIFGMAGRSKSTLLMGLSGSDALEGWMPPTTVPSGDSR